MMPSSEIEIYKTFKDDLGLKIIIEAGKNGWTIMYADSSSEYKDVEDTTENNFQAALTVLKSHFNVTECDETPMEECIDESMVNLEDFLTENGFQLFTYYQTNKRYKKEITDCQNLYVRVYSDVNKIVEVVYEHVAMTEFENEGIIPFETIETIEQLKHLIKALKQKK